MPRIFPLPKYVVKVTTPDGVPTKDYYDWFPRAQDVLQNGRSPVMTVSELPSASVAGVGARYVVTNAGTTTFNSIVSGTSTFTMPVFADNAGNWRIG